MATFILVTKLNDNMLCEVGERKAAGSHWLKRVKELCPGIKWISHYCQVSQQVLR